MMQRAIGLRGAIAGALVALCDGLVWAELSSQFPGSGGTYVYVREIFGRERWGRLFAFLFNWQFLLVAKRRRWWPLLGSLAIITVIFASQASQAHARPSLNTAQTEPLSRRVQIKPSSHATQARSALHAAWNTWHTSALIQKHGYPVFTVSKQPFFVYGAALFYERVPSDLWAPSLAAYKKMGINTIDLYLIWNWHEIRDGTFDFTGRTNPRRDLHTLFRLMHQYGFKVIVRPGPVIRNEWRNGGYPAWLLTRPEYRMPLHDVLEGRYPATATLQNAHAEAAADEWLHNPTHLRYSKRWLDRVLHEIEPWSNDIIAIALDDDQGAYIDNDTWPAPHWRQYIAWLRSTVQAAVGTRIPLFINTYQMKVTAASPVWAWGDWYQSDAKTIGIHDRDQIDFSTQLLGTQPHRPNMIAEFQAGWLQGADEIHSRAADPSNTSLALAYFLQNGAHGIVNFPVQDTWYPDGWQAPWANRFYAWDAALSSTLRKQPRYNPTYAFGALIARYGTFIASSHPRIDIDVAWLPSISPPSTDTAKIAAATIGVLDQCRAIGYTCKLVDLRFGTRDRGVPLIYPPWPGYQTTDVQTFSLPRHPGNITLVSDAGNGALMIGITNRSATVVALNLPRQKSAHSTKTIALHLPDKDACDRMCHKHATSEFVMAQQSDHLLLKNGFLEVAIAPSAGAQAVRIFDRIARREIATSIGAFRDDVADPLLPSPRDYIAAYTHPFEAGTFNRKYICRYQSTQIACSYTAPDLATIPVYFEKTFELRGNHLIVTLFSSADAASISAISTTTTISNAHASEQGVISAVKAHGYQLVRVRYPAKERITLLLTP